MWTIPLKQPRSSRISRNSLLMFPLNRKTMRKSDPSRSKVRIHHRRFTEISACFGNLVDGEVIDSDAEPGCRLIGLLIGEIVGEEEEFVSLLQFVEGAQVGWEGGDLEGVQAEDSVVSGSL